MHDCQHLFVMDLVVPLHVRETLQHEAYQVEQSVLDRKSAGVEVAVLFSTSKACCLAAPHNQSFDLWVSAWRGWVSRPASCSRELQYGPCSVGREGHELEFVIKGASSTCWLAHQSLWPTDYWRWCQSQVGAQVGDGRIQCIQCRGFRVRMEMDYRVL